MNEQITGALFKRMVLHGAAVITAQKQAINDLNVFPVPDGDTGTNMSMTIGTAVTELRKSEPATVEQAASVTASALLRGARGNSGVILSLLFRGLSKALKGRETADAAAFAAARGSAYVDALRGAARLFQELRATAFILRGDGECIFAVCQSGGQVEDEA